MKETNKIYQGDCLEVLKTLPDNFVQTCITSPPYFGLRDYGTAKWEGGNPDCDHIDERAKYDRERNRKGLANNANEQDGGERTAEIQNGIDKAFQYKGTCLKCGAKRTDQQIGLEETPKEYVEKLIEIFREVKRVLRDDGTLWLNLGDSYATTSGGGQQVSQTNTGAGLACQRVGAGKIPGIKPKDLLGIPWRVAFALQDDGWYLRQDIIWSKPNPMPKSVLDRCTKSHEYIFLLTKSPRYFYDNEAIMEPTQDAHVAWGDRKANGEPIRRGVTVFDGEYKNPHLGCHTNGKRNKRSVWTVTPKPYRGAHFATFPLDIPELCIKAGTSEKGCCPVCRSRLKRTTEEWQSTCSHNQKPVPCIVLDPFMGAGTTACACVQLKRDYIGIDISPEYCQLAEQRIADYKEGVTNFVLDLFGSAD